jgi:hypothetical protein
MFSFPKGVIWLLLATVAEVPPVVCLSCFSNLFFFFHIQFTSQVFVLLNLNGEIFFQNLSWPCYTSTQWTIMLYSEQLNMVRPVLSPLGSLLTRQRSCSRCPP